MTAGQWTLAFLLLFASGYTVWGYPHKYFALSGRSRLYRTVGLAALDLLLLLVLMGTFIDFKADVTLRVALVRQLFYWAACLVLGLTLPLVGVLDALESYTAMRRERRAFLEQIVEEEAARARQTKARNAD